MRVRAFLTVLLIMSLAPLALVTPVEAQGGNQNQCQQYVRGVMNDLGINCANLPAGEVCYGHDEIDALPVSGVTFPAGAFDGPGDTLPVTDIARLNTSEFDLNADTAGYAVIKIDAYIGMNEDTGEPETAELLYIVPSGVEVEAARAPEYDADGELILDDLHLAPMQELYLRNSYQDPECVEAVPPVLFVQSEPGEVIEFVVNEELIRLEGTAVIEILDDNTMRVTTIYGMTTLDPGSPNPTLLPPGFFADICLLEPDNLGLDGEMNDQPVGDCAWTDPQPMSRTDLLRLESLDILPTNVLFYNIVIPAIVTASGIGGPSNRFFFVNPPALQLARDACAEGLIPADVCEFLQLTYTASVCPQIVDPALAGFGTNCLATAAGLACYGNASVEGLPIAGLTFSTPFAAPGDMVSNQEVARLVTSNFDRDARTWGLSLVKVDAYVGVDGSNQPQTAELLYTLPGGVELEAAVEPTYDQDGNLVLNDQSLAPLQQAYLRLNRQEPECSAAVPPALVVQSEPGTAIDFYMNEALIRLEGTVLLDLISAGDTGQMLRLTTIDGQATVNVNAATPEVVTPGFETLICLDPPENLGLDQTQNDRPMGACEWTPPQPLTRVGLERLPALDSLPH